MRRRSMRPRPSRRGRHCCRRSTGSCSTASGSPTLFGFEYLLEMYKPAAKRRWGYFALPILHGDRFVGKLDAKADRKAGVLRVAAIHEDAPFTAEVTDAVHRRDPGARRLARTRRRGPAVSGQRTSSTISSPVERHGAAQRPVVGAVGERARLPVARRSGRGRDDVAVGRGERASVVAEGDGGIGVDPEGDRGQRREVGRPRHPHAAVVGHGVRGLRAGVGVRVQLLLGDGPSASGESAASSVTVTGASLVTTAVASPVTSPCGRRGHRIHGGQHRQLGRGRHEHAADAHRVADRRVDPQRREVVLADPSIGRPAWIRVKPIDRRFAAELDVRARRADSIRLRARASTE